MKTLFKSVFYILACTTLCATVLSSCKGEDEVYDFVFDVPGSVVAQPGATVALPFTARNITSVTVISKPNGWEVENVDLKKWEITIKAPGKYSAEDSSIVENGILKLTGYTAVGTSISATSYLSLLNQKIDLTAEPSNSYALTQKDTRYIIDATHKGESDERISPARVDLLWQSTKDLIRFYGYTPESGEFTFFVGNEEITDDNGEVTGTRIPSGNTVVAAYDANDEIIWSWHIWTTASALGEGSIVASNGVEFMNRNLGAYHNANGSTNGDDIFDGYGMFYQWDRKDPFYRPSDYAFSNNTDKTVYTGTNTTLRFKYADTGNYDEVGSLEFAIENPMVFVRGAKDNAYDWLYTSHDNTLWSGSTKSIYDPCPKGWRVPKAEDFEVFDIAAAEDAAASADMRAQYGWNLVDKVSGVEMFMPAAGRKSFESGVFTNMSDYGGDESPLPWIGYYWTAGANTADYTASSLYFDLNNTRAVNNHYEPRKAMYRANAMQVRCVRE